MFYQLPNGKVIEISTEQFVEMSDEELEYLIAYNYGEHMENPWYGSILNKQSDITLDETIEIMPDLTDIPEIDKLIDLDVDYKEEE
jgi:hypothetical protein